MPTVCVSAAPRDSYSKLIQSPQDVLGQEEGGRAGVRRKAACQYGSPSLVPAPGKQPLKKFFQEAIFSQAVKRNSQVATLIWFTSSEN